MMLPSSELRRAQPHLGTIVDIWAKGPGTSTSEAIDAAFAEIGEVHRLMSFHSADSDISRINRAEVGTAVRVDRKTYEVLRFAQELSELSEGVFDITVGGALVAAGFLPASNRCPSRDTDYRDLALLPDEHVKLGKPALLDCGGIAKGYAVDLALARLRACGMESGLVNAGGDLRFFGESQTVHLRHPHTSQLLQLDPLTDKAVASSSGFYTQSAGGGGADALVDPRSGACQEWRYGVTVIASSCMVADALTKVVRLFPGSIADLLERFDAQALIIDETDVRLVS